MQKESKRLTKNDIMAAWFHYKKFDLDDMSGKDAKKLKRNNHPPILQAMLDYLFPDVPLKTKRKKRTIKRKKK